MCLYKKCIASAFEQCCCVKLIFLSAWQSSLVLLADLLTDLVHSLLLKANKWKGSHVLPEQPPAGRGWHRSGHRLPAVQHPAGSRGRWGRRPWYCDTGSKTRKCRVRALVLKPHSCIYMNFNSLGILQNRSHAEAIFSFLFSHILLRIVRRWLNVIQPLWTDDDIISKHNCHAVANRA